MLFTTYLLVAAGIGRFSSRPRNTGTGSRSRWDGDRTSRSTRSTWPRTGAGDALFLAWPYLSRSDPLAIPPGEFFLFYLGTTSSYIELTLWLTVVLIASWSRFGIRSDPDDVL